MSNFWQRAITGTIFVAVLVGAIVMGGWYYFTVFGLVVFFGLTEFFNMFATSEIVPNKFLGITLGLSVYIFPLLTYYLLSPDSYIFESSRLVFFGVAFLSLIILASHELFRNKRKPIENVLVTFGGILYIVIPFVLLFMLYSVSYTLGPDELNYWPVLSIFILIWCNDTFAYLTGRLIGKHKLFERISPKKTWEGFIGGIVFAVVAGIILAYFLEWSYAKMITYGLVVGVIGTAGDLVESMLKRSVGVKDSGNILPGHGGILDRFDAVLFVVPVIFFLEKFIFVNH